MIQESDEKTIRNHLLGNLTEEELSRAEQRLLADDDYFEMLTVIEEELIDDYVSGDLTDEDRKQFEIYFLSTPARREKLRFAQTLNEYASRTVAPVPIPTPIPQPVWWKQMFSSPYFALAAAAMIVISIGILIWPLIFPTGPSKGLVALRDAYQGQRPVESRITVFDSPPLGVTRGGNSNSVENLKRDRAKLILLSEAQKQPSAEIYHALGAAYLAEQNFDQAIESINSALQLKNSDPSLFSDLGAAYLEKGKSKRDNGETIESSKAFEQCLNYLNKALELDNSLPEALFNLALCHQYLNNVEEAQKAWRNYLDKDPSSSWADEAKHNLKLLE